MSDWRAHHANEAEKATLHPLVRGAMEEFASNMGFRLEGLPEYGMAKVVSVAAQVARAQALGFEPDLLRLSSLEADEEVLRLARIAVEKGVPVWVLPEPVE